MPAKLQTKGKESENRVNGLPKTDNNSRTETHFQQVLASH